MLKYIVQKLSFLIVFLLLIGKPVNLCSQPQNWLHFFRYGELNDWMNTFQVTNGNAVYFIGGMMSESAIYSIIIDTGFSCQTNVSPLVSFRSSDKYNFKYSEDSSCIYLFTPDSICRIDPAKPGKISKVFTCTTRQNFSSLLGVRNFGIYVTADSGKLFVFKDNSLVFTSRPVEGFNGSLQYFDSEQRLWFSTVQNGLAYYKEGQWTYFNKNNSGLSSDKFGTYPSSKIFETKAGEIFAGSLDSGLQIFDGNNWKPFSKQPASLSHRHVRCCAFDSSGAIWVGSDGGTLRFYNNLWYCYTEQDYYQNHAPFFYTYTVNVDYKNRVWFSMLHDGIYMLDQSTVPLQCIKTKSLSIISPSQHVSILAGSRDSITWNTYGNIDSISIYYSTASNSGWTMVASTGVLYNRNSLLWTVPTIISSSYYLRIRDFEDSTVQDIAGPFSVVEAGTNLPPSLLSLPDSIMVKQNQHTNLIIHASDPEKDTLKFTYLTLPAWVTARDSILTFSPVPGSTSFILKVSVSDGKDGLATDSVKVIVEQVTGNQQPFFSRASVIVSINIGVQSLFVHASSLDDVKGVGLYNLTGRLIGLFVRKAGGFEFDRSYQNVPHGIYFVMMVPKCGAEIAYGSVRKVYW